MKSAASDLVNQEQTVFSLQFNDRRPIVIGRRSFLDFRTQIMAQEACTQVDTTIRFESLKRRTLLGVALSVLVTGFAGCGGVDQPATSPASGTLTLDGVPLADATVTFWEATAPTAGSGKTDAQGKFTITTFEAGDGAIIGEHSVLVSKDESTAVLMPSISAEGGDTDYEKMSQGADAYRAAADKKVESVIPQKYTNRVTTTFKVPVTADGPNVFEFNMEK